MRKANPTLLAAIRDQAAPPLVLAPTATFLNDVCCWNCSHSVGKDKVGACLPSVGLPIRKKKNGEWSCLGSFCSFECARRYALDRHGSKGIEHAANAACVARQLGHTVRGRIGIAPKPQSLNVYGGPLTIERYRASFARYGGKDANPPKCLPPNLIPISEFVLH